MFSWSVLYLCWGSPLLLNAVYWLAVAVVVLFTLGLWTRVTGVLTYVVAVSFTANPAMAYDADPLLVLLAFYLMVGYLLFGQGRSGQSLVARLLGPKETWLFRRSPSADGETPPASAAANLAVRLLQVHFAIVMTASALHKLQVQEWWSGVAAWFYLHPPFHTTPEDVRGLAPYAESYLPILSAASYAALAWQLAFPVFAWRRRWRPLLLGGAVLGLAGRRLPAAAAAAGADHGHWLSELSVARGMAPADAAAGPAAAGAESVSPRPDRPLRPGREQRERDFRRPCGAIAMKITPRHLIAAAAAAALTVAGINCAPVDAPGPEDAKTRFFRGPGLAGAPAAAADAPGRRLDGRAERTGGRRHRPGQAPRPADDARLLDRVSRHPRPGAVGGIGGPGRAASAWSRWTTSPTAATFAACASCRRPTAWTWKRGRAPSSARAIRTSSSPRWSSGASRRKSSSSSTARSIPSWTSSATAGRGPA